MLPTLLAGKGLTLAYVTPAPSAMHSPSTYVPSAVVAYQGPTDRRCSQWIATITRGQGPENRVRVAVPYQDGPDAAAAAVITRFNDRMNAEWRIIGPALSLDGGNRYAYPCGVDLT